MVLKNISEHLHSQYDKGAVLFLGKPQQAPPPRPPPQTEQNFLFSLLRAPSLLKLYKFLKSTRVVMKLVVHTIAVGQPGAVA